MKKQTGKEKKEAQFEEGESLRGFFPFDKGKRVKASGGNGKGVRRGRRDKG